MKAKIAIAAFLIAGIGFIGNAYRHGYSPFTSQFVQTCERAVKQRLALPSSYQRISVEESRKAITWDVFFADPVRSVSEPTRMAMIQGTRTPPVQYVALIDYQAQETTGALIRESAKCVFNSLDGSDEPTEAYWVMIDGEHNMKWAARQPNAAALQLRMFKE